MNRLYNEITTIDHRSVYILMHLKHLLHDEKLDELEAQLDECIKTARKYKNIVNSNNPYFDYEMNVVLHSLLKQGANVKTSVFINSQQILEKNHLDLFVNTIQYFFSISISNAVFDIKINQKSSSFIVLSISFFKEDDLVIEMPENILKLVQVTKSQYMVNQIEDISTFKLIVDLNGA